MLNQTHTLAAQAMRSSAAYACARGVWRMPSSFAAMTSQQQNVINGKTRAHRVQ